MEPDIQQRSSPRNDCELLLQFESLGDNCEFGLVQRYVGAEPYGLFRFNFTRLAALISGLSTKFDKLALQGQVKTRWMGEWYVEETLYGFQYHTFNRDKSADQTRLVHDQARWMRYMAEKFLESLTTTEKIFVRKGDPSSKEDMLALHDALRQLGDVTLLWVCAADKIHNAGEVEWLRPGLMCGWIEGFAPYNRAEDINPDNWIRLCRRAWSLAYRGDASSYPTRVEHTPGFLDFGGWTGSKVATAEISWDVPPPTIGATVMCHRLITDRPSGTDVFGCLLSKGIPPGGWCSTSVRIWLPNDFKGSNVDLVIAGRPSLLTVRQNPDNRDQWGHLFVSAILDRDQTTAFPRLFIAGPAGTTVYTAEWRVDMRKQD